MAESGSTEAGDSNPPIEKLKITSLAEMSFNQQILAFAGHKHKLDAVTDYSIDSKGRHLNKNYLKKEEFGFLVESYKKDPKNFLAYCRENLMRIKLDSKLTPEERRERFKRYVDNYLSLNIMLDRAAFPASNQVYQGVPDYIPDGLSDMGSDPEIDPKKRSREKIRVKKEEIYNKYRELFYSVFSIDTTKITSDQLKKYITELVAATIHNDQPYDYKNYGPAGPFAKSIPITDIAEQKLTVCRHHALYTQVLLQAFGIASRLFKNDVNFGTGSNFNPHVSNLVRMNNRWFLLDTTNPERDPKGGPSKVLLKPISEQSVDLNNQKYEWKIESGDRTYTYRSRNNMYYRIQDNTKLY